MSYVMSDVPFIWRPVDVNSSSSCGGSALILFVQGDRNNVHMLREP